VAIDPFFTPRLKTAGTANAGEVNTTESREHKKRFEHINQSEFHMFFSKQQSSVVANPNGNEKKIP